MNTPHRLAITGLLAAGTVALAPSAYAHDSLISTNPKSGSSLSQAPSSIEMTYSANIMKVGNQVAITAPNGNQTTATPTTNGTKVSVPFKASGNGSYTVTWRVTSSDGHPISGNFSFKLTEQQTSSTAKKSEDIKPVATASTTKGPSTPTTDAPGDNKPWLIGGGVVALLALLGAGWYVAKGRVKDDAGA